jgi:hypothetical protein
MAVPNGVETPVWLVSSRQRMIDIGVARGRWGVQGSALLTLQIAQATFRGEEQGKRKLKGLDETENT